MSLIAKEIGPASFFSKSFFRKEETKVAEKRFVKIYSQDLGDKMILVDRQTGVNYLFVASGYAGGLTPLLDREGKPVVSPLPVCE